MKRIIFVSILFLLVASGCYDNHSYAPEEEFTASANCSIAELRNLGNEGCYTIFSELMCVGRVTSSDRADNFYYSIFIEDATGGLEVLVGTYLTASQYPVGTMLAIDLQGLAVAFDHSTLQVGLPPQEHDNRLRYLSVPEVIRKHIIRSNSVEKIAPRRCNVAELSDTLCGCLVEVSNLSYSPLEGSDEATTLEGYQRFVDDNEGELFCYVSSYADFAGDEIPTSPISLVGILYHEPVGEHIGSKFVIRPRSKDDITPITPTL